MKHVFLASFLFAFVFSANAQNLVFKNQVENKNIASTQPVTYFVRANKTELINYLKTIGGTYKYSIKNYHHVTIPFNKVNELARQPFLQSINHHIQHPTPLNDSMRVKARVNQVHNGNYPLPQGYTGNGVLIGFIDDGVDFNHPDFQDASGNTRVLAIWDQTQVFDAVRTPPAYGYGQIWDSTDINAGICTSVDNSGHGTTVAGTACGNGFSTGTHAGAAPNSWVVMVKSNYSLPDWLGSVADAVDYMYKLADSLNMPCVVNASVGDYYGTHDGRDPAAQYIDSLIQAKRGRLMVAALGNSGQLAPYHLETYVGADTSFTWFEYNAPGGGDAFPYGSVYFEVYSDTADFQNVQFSVGADQVSPAYKHRGQGNFRNAFDFLDSTVTDTILSPAGNILGIVDYYAEVIYGDVLMLQVHMKQPDSSMYNWRFSTTGSGRFDVWSGEWLGISDMVNTGVPTVATFPDIVNYVSPDSAKTMVSSFQCLSSVVTVANYNNIQNYIGYDLNPVALGEPEGQIASTSSRGPTRDNREKPDVAATGNVTFSPGPLPILASLISLAPHKLLPDGMHMRNGGTSMASPVVSGIGGLLLERCPQMRWDEFGNYIRTSAYTDSFTGSGWNMAYGYGKVNAFGAITQTVYSVNVSGDSVICEGDPALLTAAAGLQTYTWSTGSATSSTSFDTTETIWLTGVDMAGCKSDTSFINVVVNALPSVTISLDTNWFTAESVLGIYYQWYLNGGPISGATNSSYYPLVNGDYWVMVTDANGCTSSSTMLPYGGASINEFGDNWLSVYPNPFTNMLTIDTKLNCTVTIRNSIGQVVLANSIAKTISTGDWETGIYHVTVSSPESVQTFKLVKSR
ncbi:MAG TPA: S8 family peptidase [Flavobacteriales bacterium]|nr:S8 family peptidase [Flavobacteriales bacterium]